MTVLFKKLNFKNHTSILALHAPSSFQAELNEMSAFTSVFQSIEDIETLTFVIVFVQKQVEIDTLIAKTHEKMEGDAILWFCYPKGTSKNYKCDFNRDTGWASVGALGLESVRMVAIDEDWSALRFRKVEFVKTITRRESFALTQSAKERTKQKGV